MARPRALTVRERQAIDYIMACGYSVNAYSISFDVSRARVKALIYYNREEMETAAKSKVDAGKADDAASARTHAPPARPSSSSHAQEQTAKKPPQKQAKLGKRADSHKPHTVDRNALSACGSSVTISDAAIAAQARADASKESAQKEPAQKRRRLERSPSPADAAAGCPLRAFFVSEADKLALETVAKRNNFAVPATPDEGDIFLRAIMGLNLYEDDGDIVGYNTLTGENVGGGDAPLPPGARAAFVIANGGWQTVTARKDKRRPS